MLQLKRSLLAFLWLSLICGLIYPLVVTVTAQAVFQEKANGSIIKQGNQIMGSQWIGQLFTSSGYFHGRPQASDPQYDASNSGGSNLAPSSAKLIESARKRIEQVRRENDLTADAKIPADLVLTSASGLDPHISPASAELQVRRIAMKRKISEADLRKIIRRYTEQPLLGIWGQERVNVLLLNLALDNACKQNVN
ncbi:MAG: potassium-transporting ATPase subunit KdpC [Syntrophaceae bacterium]|nr:potassium-transporting ATPase subunit KdpC [Syntrophaceae bacterium]